MPIVSHPANAAFRDNFEETFGPKPKRPNECRIYNTTCPTPELCKLSDPDAPCCAGQTAAAEERLFDCSYCTHAAGTACGCICHTKAP